MREFVYYSRTAPTKGNFGTDLRKAGRIDIAIHSVIAAFFLSHKFREDVKLHLVFAGPPDPQKHLELKPVVRGQTAVNKIYMGKNDVSSVLKRVLYKYKEGKKNEAFPGFWIEKKGFLEVVKDLYDSNRDLYLLDKKGEDIRSVNIKGNPVFILGDHLGLPKKEFKRLRKMCRQIAVGKRTYFASQTIAIVNNEIDRREDSGKME